MKKPKSKPKSKAKPPSEERTWPYSGRTATVEPPKEAKAARLPDQPYTPPIPPVPVPAAPVEDRRPVAPVGYTWDASSGMFKKVAPPVPTKRDP